jgi:hypothetical protein
MKSNQPVKLAEEFVLRAGIPDDFFTQSLRVENSLRERNFFKARLQLYKLFLLLAEGNETDIKQEPDDNVLSFVFWNRKVYSLTLGSPENAFKLAVKCISAIEDFMLLSEDLQVCAYSAALGSVDRVLHEAPSSRDVVSEVLKNIMMRSSEFLVCSVTQDIFDMAADRFLKVLELYSPSERYNQIFEMSVWLGTRKAESPYLQVFVDKMLSIAEEYENGVKYIPDDIPPDEPQRIIRPSYLKLVHSSPS